MPNPQFKSFSHSTTMAALVSTASHSNVPGILLLTAAVLFGTGRPARAGGLDAPVTATWSGIGLRDWAERAGEAAGLPVFVDPRLDPDTPIRLDCREEPLRDVIARGARAAGGDVAALRSSVWIVPLGKAETIQRAELARDLRVASLPSRQRAALSRRRPWHWNAGARPRDLVREIATESRVVVDGIDMVPHDHIPARSLPELTVAERLDILLIPFDLRVDWQKVDWQKTAETGSASSGQPKGRIIAIDADLPGAMEPIGSATTAAAPPPRRPSREGAKRGAEQPTFSLQVAAPLDELLTVCGKRMGLELDLDRESLNSRGVSPGEIVRLTVKDVTRKELLDRILTPLNLSWEIHDDTLRVFAR